MRRNLLMLVALIIWSVVMMINARFQVVEGRSIRGITNPGLAMQFARSTSEDTDLLGDAQIEPGKSNWQVMR